MQSIHTPRLDITPLSLTDLRVYLDELQRLEQKLGIGLSRAVLTPVVQSAIRTKIIKMEAAPTADHLWYTYWLVVVRKASFGAGLIGYKGLGQGKDEVEIGYGIDPAYSGRGYTTEAVAALIEWAFDRPDLEAVTTTETLKTNLASLRIQEKLGFVLTQETETMVDQRLTRAAWLRQR